MTRRPFQQTVREMMARTGKSFRACCVALGRKGGQAAAAKKRRAAAEKVRIDAARQKLEAMKLV